MLSGGNPLGEIAIGNLRGETHRSTMETLAKYPKIKQNQDNPEHTMANKKIANANYQLFDIIKNQARLLKA